jgi:nucleotide-binding universal stress UspA family protein
VPVLLRHPDRPRSATAITGPRRIIVPVDGSEFSERAVRLASQLASETSGEVVLIQVVPPISGYAMLGGAYGAAVAVRDGDAGAAEQYLARTAAALPCKTRTQVLVGPVSGTLIQAARRLRVTDVVLASHGRTGLSRVVLGSVTDDLIQRLHCPIVVLPVLSPQKLGRPIEHATLQPV